MEPLTHFLTGAALGRSGLNRRSAYVTAVMVLAAEAPDLDVLYSLRGPVTGFQHHRGWTHTLIATPMVAAVTVAVVLGVARLLGRKNTQPVSVGWLLLCGWLAALSHIALDWSNNYGVRPFWPFSPRWFEGDLVFILEPVILAALLLAVVVPWLLGLADREIGGRQRQFRGRGWAILALTVTGVVWGVRAVEHHRAIGLLQARAWNGADAKRVMAGPQPVTPFQWNAVVDRGDSYQRAYVNARTGNVRSDDRDDVFYKSAVTPAISAAEASQLGRAYMDWSSWPLVTAEQPMQDPQSAVRALLKPVEFRDLRFAFPVLGSERGKGALSAQALVAPNGEVVEQRMGSRVQK